MTDSKSISPYGWYVGSYLLRFIELAEQGNEDPERRFATWENTVLVKANTLDEAYDKVVKVAMEGTEPYKGGTEGVDVQWVFEGVTDLLPIYEEIEDGAEIMWANPNISCYLCARVDCHGISSRRNQISWPAQFLSGFSTTGRTTPNPPQCHRGGVALDTCYPEAKRSATSRNIAW